MSDTFDSGRIARALFAVDAMKRRLGTVLAEELKPGMNVCWKRNGVQLGKIQSVTIKFNGSAVITVTNHYTHRTYRISEADLMCPERGELISRLAPDSKAGAA